MTKLLVTGARGFTGRHLVQTASTAGYQVFPLQSDLSDSQALALEIETIAPEYVIHLAAISAATHADEETLYRTNLFGTLKLLNTLAMLPNTPQKILLASSAHIYGNAPAGIIKETHAPAPISHYAISKLAMEFAAATYFDRLPIVIIRPFNYTGVGHDERFLIPKIVRHFAQKLTIIELGNLDILREYNDVRAICDAYIKLLKHGIPRETYNLCTGRPTSLKEVIDILTSLTDHVIKIKVNPNFIRTNEIQRLCGCKEKLEKCIGQLKSFTLKDTLDWMLVNLGT